MSIWEDWNDDERDSAEAPELMAANPIPLADRRAIDLVECPSCRTVQSIGSVEAMEERTVKARDERGRKRDHTLNGVFCGVPSCGRLLFDQDGWVRHLADRRVFDRDHDATAEHAGGDSSEADAAIEGAA